MQVEKTEEKVVGQSKTTKKRFWSKVKKTKDCWWWLGGKTKAGYGRIWVNPKEMYAHRLSYLYYKGEIREGLEVDHLCKNRSCVNPDHLEAVSHYVNTIRGSGVCANNARKQTCPLGHEYIVKFYKDKRLKNSSPKQRRRCPVCIKETNRLRYVK